MKAHVMRLTIGAAILGLIALIVEFVPEDWLLGAAVAAFVSLLAYAIGALLLDLLNIYR